MMTKKTGCLLRMCSKLLILAVFAGITTDFVVSKTVTKHPSDHPVPCDGRNCDHPDHKLDSGAHDSAVHQMHQKPHDPHEETESKGHNIDPDSLLHQAGDDHVHDGSAPVETNAQDIGADAPDIGKEVLGGLADAAPEEEEINGEEHGPDMEATLHGGQKHVHSTGNEPRSVEHNGVFGVDPEEMLHGGKDAHSHGASDQAERQNSEGNFNLGTDIEAMLHGGDEHVHSPGKKHDRGGGSDDGIREVPIGASDPEALLHDGNGHVHAHGGAKSRTDPDPRPYGAADPEQILHGSDDHHVHTIRQAMDGSRPLSGSKDPDVVSGMDVNPMDIRVGTLRPEDTDDYHRWKSEKESRMKAPSQTSGWLSGFSYIKDTILKDLEVVRKRYLPSIFGEAEEELDPSGSGAGGKRTHDEA